MTFDELLTQVLELLQRHGRVSSRALKRRFDLDNDYLEDLKAEIIQAKRLAIDEDGAVLVWTGATAAVPAGEQSRAPLTYTPSHLTEKILAARPTLAGERKQVTVFFADTKDSTKLIEGLDPEAAQRLLDPAIHTDIDAGRRWAGPGGRPGRGSRCGQVAPGIRVRALPPHAGLAGPSRTVAVSGLSRLSPIVDCCST